MEKKLIIVGIIVILLIVGLSGCSESSQKSVNREELIGTWKLSYNDVKTLIFDTDGTYKSKVSSFVGSSGDWYIQNGKLIFEHFDYWTGEKIVTKCDCSISNNELEIAPETGLSIRVFYKS